MEIHNTPQGELLSCGKNARVTTFPCGHIIVSVAGLRLGFGHDDFADFADAVSLAVENLRQREKARAEWGLFL